jgi:hypothetical protein
MEKEIDDGMAIHAEDQLIIRDADNDEILERRNGKFKQEVTTDEQR